MVDEDKERSVVVIGGGGMIGHELLKALGEYNIVLIKLEDVGSLDEDKIVNVGTEGHCDYGLINEPLEDDYCYEVKSSKHKHPFYHKGRW